MKVFYLGDIDKVQGVPPVTEINRVLREKYKLSDIKKRKKIKKNIQNTNTTEYEYDDDGNVIHIDIKA